MALPSHNASLVSACVLRGILRDSINPDIGMDWRAAELVNYALDLYATRLLAQEHAIALGSIPLPDGTVDGHRVAPAVEFINPSQVANIQVNTLHVAEPVALGLIEQQLQLFGPIKHLLFSFPSQL